MTTDLRTQIRGYFDEINPPFEPDQLMAHPAAGRISDGRVGRLGLQRFPGWAYAAATAAIVLLLVGGGMWLSSFLGEETPPAITQPTTPTPPTTAVEGAVPAWATPDPIDETSGIAVADGLLWASTEGGMVRWDLADRRADLFTPADGLPFSEGASGDVVIAPDGMAWAFTWNQDLAYFDGNDWSEPARYDQLDIVNPRCVYGEDCRSPITAIAVGPDGLLSVAVGPMTLLQYDGDKWSVISVTTEANGVGAYGWANDMAVAEDGTLWAATGEELLSFDGETWEHFTTGDGLPAGLIDAVASAPNGDVWVATGGNLEGDRAGGVARFDGDSWTVFDVEDGLYDNAVLALAVGSDGTVWAVHGPTVDTGFAETRAAGGVSRFDGTAWSATTIPDVGLGFGWGGAAVDDTGTLWITSRWGIVGFDGTEITVLRVPEDTRPVLEVPHVVIEGGEDILATTLAKPARPVATCPAGSNPNQPGPIDQTRPPTSWYIPAAMDRQSGRLVAVIPADPDSPADLQTWTLDVCTNTWALMNQPGFHRDVASWADRPTILVYDAASDLVVGIGATFVDAYDFDTDTWKRLGPPPSENRFDPRAIYDPVSGLIVVRNIADSEMWAYDVETDTWTPIRQGPVSPPWRDERPESTVDSTVFGQLHTYDLGADRIVLYLSDNGAGAPTTWSYDLRAGEWTVEDTVTPALHVGAYGQPYSKAAYDEKARRTVITADGVVGGYDAERQEWEILWASSSEPNAYGVGTGLHHRLGDTIIYDPTNQRIIVIGGDARMLNENPFWVPMNDASAFDASAGAWSILLAQSTP